jgi:hypothetical protein
LLSTIHIIIITRFISEKKKKNALVSELLSLPKPITVGVGNLGAEGGNLGVVPGIYMRT